MSVQARHSYWLLQQAFARAIDACIVPRLIEPTMVEVSNKIMMAISPTAVITIKTSTNADTDTSTALYAVGMSPNDAERHTMSFRMFTQVGGAPQPEQVDFSLPMGKDGVQLFAKVYEDMTIDGLHAIAERAQQEQVSVMA